jgi:hypothetical protein
MKVSTLPLLGSLATSIVAEFLLNIVVLQDTLRTAELRGQKSSSGDVEKISAYEPDRNTTFCPSVGPLIEASASSCKTPYTFHNYFDFAEATTIPRSVNITLSDNDTPRHVSDGV